MSKRLEQRSVAILVFWLFVCLPFKDPAFKWHTPTRSVLCLDMCAAVVGF